MKQANDVTGRQVEKSILHRCSYLGRPISCCRAASGANFLPRRQRQLHQQLSSAHDRRELTSVSPLLLVTLFLVVSSIYTIGRTIASIGSTTTTTRVNNLEPINRKRHCRCARRLLRVCSAGSVKLVTSKAGKCVALLSLLFLLGIIPKSFPLDLEIVENFSVWLNSKLGHLRAAKRRVGERRRGDSTSRHNSC